MRNEAFRGPLRTSHFAFRTSHFLFRYNPPVHQQAGIYIHIPFCEQKCTYCNFNTTDFSEMLASRYVRAVALEIKHWGSFLTSRNPEGEAGKPRVDTIFFGGGTPSIVEAAQILELIDACKAAFEVAPDAELTIEINPGTFAGEKLAAWREAGINRASVGVQSFIDRELVSLSRTHTATGARLTVEALREAGFSNISLDLIAGFPDQTSADWEFNLHEALMIRPEHLSLYLLEVKEGTQLFAQIERGLRPRPDDDVAADMYRSICRATREAGYEHYEISNFAVNSGEGPGFSGPGAYRSKHNMKYWSGTAFYGMGCGAHSYDGRARWVNTLKTESYIDGVEATGIAVRERRELSERERAEEALFMGLRLSEGVSLEAFALEYGVDILDRYGEELERLAEAGLLEVEERRLRLTEAGMLLSNEVFVSFV
jgi:oxygen-independent coproporphyrinogen-3 oxidase